MISLIWIASPHCILFGHDILVGHNFCVPVYNGYCIYKNMVLQQNDKIKSVYDEKFGLQCTLIHS